LVACRYIAERGIETGIPFEVDWRIRNGKRV
jgi:hypothetical protein